MKHTSGTFVWAAFVVVASTLGLPGTQAAAQAPAPPPGTTPPLSMFTEQLPIPPMLDETAPGSSVHLCETASTHVFHSSLPATPSWGYTLAGASGSCGPASDAYLGPTLQTKRDVPLTLNVTNNLGAHPLAQYIDHTLTGVVPSDASQPRTALHLHGGHTPAASDGGPAQTFLPGQSFTYNYPNDQEATNLWYHDHAMGLTRLNVINGMAGYYLLRDTFDTGAASNPLGLPAPYGTCEVPLVFQDRMFKADGTLNYGFGPFYNQTGLPPGYPDQWEPEFFGDVATVNGKVWPNLNVNRGLYRFRVINGSNARFYDFRLVNSMGAQLYQIGDDGGLLNAPVPLSDLVIAPGERADLLIDFSKAPAGTKIELKNSAPAPFPSGPRAPRRGGVPLPDIMQFTVGTGTGCARPVPASLRGGANQPPALPATTGVPLARVRNVYLNELIDPATGNSVGLRLNNQPMDNTTNVERPTAGTFEQWNLINTTVDAHPIHLHLTQFRVLGSQKFDAGGYVALLNKSLPAPGLPNPSDANLGPWPAPSADPFTQGGMSPPSANEAGWKDTVIALPGTITRILVPFTSGAGTPFDANTSLTSGPDGYVWHCHIIEHEDNEMMRFYGPQ